MLQFDEIKLTLENLKPDLDYLADALNIPNLKVSLKNLEEKTTFSSFWDGSNESKKTLAKISSIKNKINNYNKLYNSYEDALTILELFEEQKDDTLLEEAQKEINNIKKELQSQKLSTLLSGEYDEKNAILTLHAGAGGVEAQDWVQMLYRMYCHWAEKHKYKVKTLDFLDGDEAGIKNVSFLVEGDNAYGFLKSENGVHRLVRISPFDASGRRHTSFASVEVMPEIDDDIKIEISPDDLKMDVFRSSGAGGQHINKTSSAVRLTHIPTGIVAACQNERSQHQNREMALKMIKSKLIEIKEREHLNKIEDIKGIQKEIGWGSQIRSYVFMPYTLVKDHRTNYEVGNISAVMDGDLDGFINAYLKLNAKSK